MNQDRKLRKVTYAIITIFLLLSSLFILPGSADEEGTTVSVSPELITVSPNETFSFSILCSPNQPIKSYELSFSFDENLLSVNSVSEGDIFEGYSTFFNDGTIDNSNGEVNQIYGLIIGSGNVTETGSLVDISCTAKNSVGISDITLFNVGITNETKYIQVSLVNGSVSIEDIMPTIGSEQCMLSDPVDTEASIGWCNLSISVLDDNLDCVKLVVTNPDSTVTNISMNTIDDETFYLNMSGFIHGSYSYYVYIADDCGNHLCSDEHSFVIGPNWDVSMDGMVTVFDLILISNRFDETGSAGWIREDVDNNGIVQLSDIMTVSNYYSHTW